MTWFDAGTKSGMKGAAQGNVLRQVVTVGTGLAILRYLGGNMQDSVEIKASSWQLVKGRATANMLEQCLFIGLGWFLYGRER